VAQVHQVCPFELSLDLSVWVDALVGDYNYLFDPQVYLRRHFAEPAGDYGFLVDEAHNLPERARAMFSADLGSDEIREARRAIQDALPRCARALGRLGSAIRALAKETEPSPETDATSDGTGEPDLFTSADAVPAVPVPAGDPSVSPGDRAWARGVLTRREFPAALRPLLQKALDEAEAWLARNEPAGFRECLLALYFRFQAFLRTAELFDERFVTILEPGAAGRIRLFCLDPSCLLAQALARGKAAVFFSATLTPLAYYRRLLGGHPEDPLRQLPSPFPSANLAVLVHDGLRTQLKARAETLRDVAQTIGALVQGRRGNYLVYLPSYQYLETLRAQFQALHPNLRLLAQRPGMAEPEREAFLSAFAADHAQTLVGFAVMGGIFGEGIDLVGDRLIGAVIVGVGLPQPSPERELIRDHFEETTGAGYDYAYRFPGMNRVLQATGRVIRSETDRGVVLLIDTRFGERRYRRLFPAWWQTRRVRSLAETRAIVDRFWQDPT
jgi:DNA excision repair protein ERCC-2